MTTQRAVFSLLIVFHVVALSVNAVPPPDELQIFKVEAQNGTHAAGLLTRALDTAGLWVSRVEPGLFTRLNVVRVWTAPYTQAGLAQAWGMFATPETISHYGRLAYYVTSPGATRPRVVRELVFPSDREDRVRLFHDYRDKAMESAHDSFVRARKQTPVPATAADGLLALMRSYTRQFAEHTLSAGERVVRTEYWSGTVPIPRPGERQVEGTVSAHADALQVYYEGPSPAVLVGSEPPLVGTEEHEADIVWQLEFVDEP